MEVINNTKIFDSEGERFPSEKKEIIDVNNFVELYLQNNLAIFKKDTLGEYNRQLYTLTNSSRMREDFSEIGEFLFCYAQKIAENMTPKGIFEPEDYYFVGSYSGLWIPDKESRFYNPSHVGFLCGKDNLRLVFITENIEKITSEILFWKPAENQEIGWAITKSGSLYKFKQKTGKLNWEDCPPEIHTNGYMCD